MLITSKRFMTLSILLTGMLFLVTTCNDDSPTKYEPPIIPPIGGMPSTYQDVSVSPD